MFRRRSQFICLAAAAPDMGVIGGIVSMRVLCVAAAYPPNGKGGGPKGSENLAKALSARGHKVRVLTVADREGFEVRDGIQVKTLKSLNVYWNYWINQSVLSKLIWHALENFNPRALLRMRREIIAFRPDVVVTISIENVNVATWVAAWMLGCPSVHVIQSYFLMCWRGTMFSKNKNCERRSAVRWSMGYLPKRRTRCLRITSTDFSGVRPDRPFRPP